MDIGQLYKVLPKEGRERLSKLVEELVQRHKGCSDSGEPISIVIDVQAVALGHSGTSLDDNQSLASLAVPLEELARRFTRESLSVSRIGYH